MRARTTLSLSFLGFVGAGSAAALGTYLLFNPRLRKQMMESDSPVEAAGLLGSSVRKDALETADQTMEAVRHGWLSKHLRHAKRTLGHRFARTKHIARRHAKMLKSGTKEAAAEMKQEAVGTVHDLSAEAEEATS